MKRLVFKMRGVFFALCAFLVYTTSANATYVHLNEGVINDKVNAKIEEMGSELFSQTGISVYAVALPTINGKKITEYEAEIANSLRIPFVLFTLVKNDHQVDIIYSKGMEELFDKEAVLSPFPWTGTVLPLLAEKKEGDKYNAAILNGYADIVERIASSKDIKLQSAIGDTNKDIYITLKIVFYGFLALMLFTYLYRKSRK